MAMRLLDIDDKYETTEDSPAVKIKWNHHDVFRRFEVPLRNGYATLIGRIKALVPEFHEQLSWKDEDGDFIALSSDDEFVHAASLPENQKLLRLFTTEFPINVQCMKPVEAAPKTEEPRVMEHHRGVTCDGCDKDVVGIRYKCAICPDFDLCEGCERKALHAEHAMIRYVSPRSRPLGRFHHPHRRCPFPGNKSPFHDGIFGPGPYQKFSIAAKGAALQAAQDALRVASNLNASLNSSNKSDEKVKATEEEQKKKNETSTQENSEQSQSNVIQGMEYLREIGAQVQKALANFGIDVDMSVSHDGATEKVPANEQKGSESHNVFSSAEETVEVETAEKKEAEKRNGEVQVAKQSDDQVENATVPVKTMNIFGESSREGDSVAVDAEKHEILSDEKDVDNEKDTKGNVKACGMESTVLGTNHNLLTNLVQSDGELLLFEDAGSDGWTIMGVQNAPSENPNLYPVLSKVSEECRGGIPFLHPPAGPHDPHCSFIHPDPVIANCVQQIELMGFDNCNGWITNLATVFYGDVGRVIEAMGDDPVYSKRALINSKND